MKIFLAQQNYHIGNFEANTAKISDAIRQSKEQGGDLVVFSELAVCGYPPRDFLEFNDFVQQSINAIETIAGEAQGIGVIVGGPSRNPVVEGKDLFNSAYLLYDGKIQAVVNKTLLPTYDIFDEYRYFEPGNEWNVHEFMGKKLAITICEDIWNLGDNPLYRICPMDKLIEQRPDVIINISASPFDYAQAQERLGIVKQNVSKYKVPMVYCNTVGSQTEIVFDGGSVVMDAGENLVAELPYFQEALVAVDLKDDNTFAQPVIKEAVDIPYVDPMPKQLAPTLDIDEIYDALIMGIRDYFGKMGFTKATVASSGGIDSAVTLVLACHALGSENVDALLMPSEFSTGHSVDDAVRLSENLNNPYNTLS
ncbi:MAG: NAD+ synthase, partial [Chitinophagaceae bacterium]|nr:NAD+ synthase [Chitinophagaceae bacterium]